MIFDMTKVTYNTYSCAISGMSREKMKMDSRDSVECQNWGKKDIDVILEFGLSRKRQNATVSSPTFTMKTKNVLGRVEIQNVRSSGFVIFF